MWDKHTERERLEKLLEEDEGRKEGRKALSQNKFPSQITSLWVVEEKWIEGKRRFFLSE